MTADPASPPTRIDSLDTVRGVAVMGILLMNIVGFAMIEPAYLNPRAYGGAEGADLWVWLINFVAIDGKMRGLFSFLFGASMLLVIERAEAKGEDAARVHYARMAWLLLFGLAHLWLLWWGDILHHYALIGMIAFVFREKSVLRLVAIGVAMIAVQSVMAASVPMFVLQAQADLASSDPATAAKAVTGMADFAKGFGVPPPDVTAADLAEHRGTYATLLAARFAEQLGAPLRGLGMFGWETLGYMLFGMAALKSGMLTGAWPRARYMKWMAVGFGVSLPAYAALAAWLMHSEFALLPMVIAAVGVTAPLRPFAIVGWACLILLLARPGGALTERIAAAGRMAFTNYLATSLICTTLFYGYGLGWYGQLSRAELYLVVPAIWALMLLWSKPWLTRYRFGPFEWIWRSLARGRLQPMRQAVSR